MPFSRIFRSIVLALAASALAASPSAAQTGAACPAQPVPILEPGQGLFLHLSDIHFDPFDVPGHKPKDIKDLVDTLLGKDVSEWEGIFQKLNLPFPDTGSGNQYIDTNYPLLLSALEAASRHGTIDYVVNTGDYLRHDFVGTAAGYMKYDEVSGFATHTIEFVNLMIRKYLKGTAKEIPLVGALGNNDSACNDYQLSPPNSSSSDTVDKPLLTGVGDDLLPGNSSARDDFRKGGYYVIPHPNPHVKNHDVIVLSVLWNNKYADQCGPKGYTNTCDPGNDTPGGVALCWLENTLKAEKQAGRRASLVMHIPPGIDEFSHPTAAFWTDQYNDAFASTIVKYKDILRDGYAGHTHDDEFRILQDDKGAAYLAVHMAPSVTPWRNTWPAFTIFVYDTATGNSLDYTTYRLDGGSHGGSSGCWNPVYSFVDAYHKYGISKYDPASLKDLADKIDPVPYDPQNKVCGEFIKYYNYGSGASTCSQSKACALNNLTPTAYDQCVK